MLPSCSEQVFFNGSHAGSFSFPTMINIYFCEEGRGMTSPQKKVHSKYNDPFLRFAVCNSNFSKREKNILLGSFAQRSQVAPSILHVLWDQQLWMPFEARVFLILVSWENMIWWSCHGIFECETVFFFLGSPFMAGYSFAAWTLYQSWRVQDVTTILLEDCKICGSCSLSEAVLLVWPVDLFSLIKVCWSFVVRKAIHKFWFATKQGHLLELYAPLAVTSFDRISVCVCNMLLSLLALPSLFDMLFFAYIHIYI